MYYEVEITANGKTVKAYQVVENGMVIGYVDENGMVIGYVDENGNP